MGAGWKPLVAPFKSKLDCSHGYFANCPVHSYNCPETEMQGLPIAAEVGCGCSHYCANWPNCMGGGYRSHDIRDTDA